VLVLTLLVVLLVSLLLLVKSLWTGPASPGVARCPRCGMPHRLALQVREHKRFCPYVASRECPYDPRRGLYRQRR
jgi:hypothetical protein